MTNRAVVAIQLASLMVLEAVVTVATAYQHHSEARWEISAAYFGTVVGYVLARLVIWLPLMLVGCLLIWTWQRASRSGKRWAVSRMVLIGVMLEVGTTCGSLAFQDAGFRYGIFFGSFSRYFLSRVLVWSVLAGVCCWLIIRRTSIVGSVRSS